MPSNEARSEADRITVLMYHRVGEAVNDWERKYCVSPQRFASHMRALERRGMHACTLEAFASWLDGRQPLPQGAFLLTFDDGFMGVHEHAFPILAELRWPAVMFLVSGRIGQDDGWTVSENPAKRTFPLLGRSEIEAMSATFSFQSHSRSHVDLTRLPRDELARELRGAREDLEAMLDRPVRYLAYPYGRHDDTVVRIARESGYDAAFSVQPGFNRRDVDRYRIRRLDVFGSDTDSALLRKVAYGTNDGSWRQPLRYYGSRVRARLLGPGSATSQP